MLSQQGDLDAEALTAAANTDALTMDELKKKEMLAKGVVANDSDNLALDLVMFWGSSQTVAEVEGNAMTFNIAVVFWCIWRIAHTIFYTMGINGKYKLRSLAFVFSKFMVFIGAILGLQGAFN